MVFVIILKSKRFVIVKDDWVQNPIESEETKVFYSPDENSAADFDLEVKFLFNNKQRNVYFGYVWKRFGECSKRFIAKKFYNTNIE